MTPPPETWPEHNQHALLAALQQVRACLVDNAGADFNVGSKKPPRVSETLGGSITDPQAPAELPTALDSLCASFNLSAFERAIILLCAGLELDSDWASLCAAAQGNPGQPFPTFSLALARLPDAHWSALTPSAPLRRWRLVEVGNSATVVQAPLRLDERVLHFLTGLTHLDEHLLGFVEPVRPTMPAVPSHQAIARQAAEAWTRPGAQLPAVQLVGAGRPEAESVAGAICQQLGLGLHHLAAFVIPTTPHELESLLRLWEREAILSGSALWVDSYHLPGEDGGREHAMRHFINQLNTPLIVSGPRRQTGLARPCLTFELHKPTSQEQQQLWRVALGPAAGRLNGQATRLANQFDLNAVAIQAACAQALGPTPDAHQLPGRLWEACRLQARPQLDDLAQRIETGAAWEDLVLPERENRILHDIALHVRQRATVYESWGFAEKSRRGLGIAALFTGPSGTGKTLAAEVLAQALQLDLYRIDLSQVVSKYIGETEKNLARVFDAAESGGAILLFDEADALFGRRSEVKDSHDRYANIEVGYLLQRMEAYRGLAILTTNMKDALDNAFLRRLRFTVQFPFPSADLRQAIWQRIFPPATPTTNLDYAKLAQLNLAGGHIRNIALNAAFYAADEAQPVAMRHILRAAQAEYAKLERTLTSSELRGWPTG